jgi:hypothetical protein
MSRRGGGLIYFLLGIYTAMISWFYNHSILLLIIHYLLWPVYLIYELLIGHLANGMWKTIPESYFK